MKIPSDKPADCALLPGLPSIAAPALCRSHKLRAPARTVMLRLVRLILFSRLIVSGSWAAEPATPGAAPPAATEKTSAAPDGKLTELSLEQLSSVEVDTVYGASKHDQATTEAPAAVSVVNRQDIKQYGYRTLGDLLRSVRGFYVGYDRSYNFIGVRGINRPGDFGGRVLINIDGHRLNEPIYGSAFSDTDFLLDMDLVDKVEIIRGPGSSLYGDNAFFTVINVITRRGRDLGGIETSGVAASYDTYSGRISYGNRFTNGMELLISGTYLDSAGQPSVYYPEYNDVNHGRADRLDGTEVKSAYASLAYGDFSLSGGFIDRRKHSPAAQYEVVFNDPRMLNIDERAYGELRFAHEFEPDWSLQVRAYYDHYRYDGFFPFNYSAPLTGPITINRDLNQGEWVGGEILLSKTLWERQRLTLGTEIRDDFDLSLSNFDVDPPVNYLQSHRQEWSVAVYGEDEIRILTNLTLNVGVRYDRFSTFGDTVNPRAALLYRPWSSSTFKFIFGQAFRAPNAYELYYIQPTFKSNPGLRPETIQSYELVWEQALPAHLRASGSLFLNQIDSLVGQSYDPIDSKNFFANLDQVDDRGFEAELEGRWAGGLRARASYTFSQAINTATHQALNNAPRHLGKINVALPLWQEKIFAGLEFQATSSRTTVQGNQINGFWIANATIFSQELVKNLEASVSVYNLFDAAYSDPGSSDYRQDVIAQDRRAFRVKLTYRF